MKPRFANNSLNDQNDDPIESELRDDLRQLDSTRPVVPEPKDNFVSVFRFWPRKRIDFAAYEHWGINE